MFAQLGALLATAALAGAPAPQPVPLSRLIGAKVMGGFSGTKPDARLRMTSATRAAVSAAAAGVDIELVASARGSERCYRALLRAARNARLPRSELEASYTRIRTLMSGV